MRPPTSVAAALYRRGPPRTPPQERPIVQLATISPASHAAPGVWPGLQQHHQLPAPLTTTAPPPTSTTRANTSNVVFMNM